MGVNTFENSHVQQGLDLGLDGETIDFSFHLISSATIFRNYIHKVLLKIDHQWHIQVPYNHYRISLRIKLLIKEKNS